MGCNNIAIPLPTETLLFEHEEAPRSQGSGTDLRLTSIATQGCRGQNSARDPVVISATSVTVSVDKSPELVGEIITWLQPISGGVFQTLRGSGNFEIPLGTYIHRVGGISITCTQQHPNLFISSNLSYS